MCDEPFVHPPDVATKLVTKPSTVEHLTEDEIDYARASLTSLSIWLQTAPNPLWLLQPLLSVFNFRKVPVAFQVLVQWCGVVRLSSVLIWFYAGAVS